MKEALMTITVYQWLCLLGFPSAVAAIVGFFKHYINKQKTEIDAVKVGVQAMLRAQMLEQYQHYKNGYVPIYVKDNFENLWIQYEALGQNGVMSDIHRRFMELPIADDDT